MKDTRRLPDGRRYADVTVEERLQFNRRRRDQLRERRLRLQVMLGRRRPYNTEERGEG
jgi:hypothetical protein